MRIYFTGTPHQMKNLNLLSFALMLMVCLAAGVYSQTKPTASPSPTDDKNSGLLKLSSPGLKDELGESEVEPRLKQFRINLRFLRAQWSHKEGKYQYYWAIFPRLLFPFSSLSIRRDFSLRLLKNVKRR
jgi:hypothetical protein